MFFLLIFVIFFYRNETNMILEYFQRHKTAQINANLGKKLELNHKKMRV